MTEQGESGIDKPTENWTRFPNSILDNLDQFEPNEFKVLAFVIRKNLGWRDRANRRFAVRYVAARLNMADRTAWAAIQGLEKKGLIHCIDRERSGLKLYEVTWKIPVKNRRVRGVAKNATGHSVVKNTTLPLQKMQTVLETKVKETIGDSLTLTPPLYKESKTNKKRDKTKKKEVVHSIESIKVFEAIQIFGKQDLRSSQAAEDHISELLQSYSSDDICGAYLQFSKDRYWIDSGLPLAGFKKQFDKYHVKAQAHARASVTGWHSQQQADRSPADLKDLEKVLAEI